jgi:hypothetical protein
MEDNGSPQSRAPCGPKVTAGQSRGPGSATAVAVRGTRVRRWLLVLARPLRFTRGSGAQTQSQRSKRPMLLNGPQPRAILVLQSAALFHGMRENVMRRRSSPKTPHLTGGRGHGAGTRLLSAPRRHAFGATVKIKDARPLARRGGRLATPISYPALRRRRWPRER